MMDLKDIGQIIESERLRYEKRISELEDILGDFTVALKSLVAVNGIMIAGKRTIEVADKGADYFALKVENVAHGRIRISANPILTD